MQRPGRMELQEMQEKQNCHIRGRLCWRLRLPPLEEWATHQLWLWCQWGLWGGLWCNSWDINSAFPQMRSWWISGRTCNCPPIKQYLERWTAPQALQEHGAHRVGVPEWRIWCYTLLTAVVHSSEYPQTADWTALLSAWASHWPEQHLSSSTRTPRAPLTRNDGGLHVEGYAQSPRHEVQWGCCSPD